MNTSETNTGYFIGIDGGGTKTKFLVGRPVEGVDIDMLLYADGLQVIGEYIAGGCHYMQIGFDGVEELFRKGIKAACENAGIEPSDVDFIFAGFAGYGDVAADQPMLDDALAKAFGDIPYAAGNDSENALEGAHNGTRGINIVAGTGSIGSGRNDRGEFMRCGGWHYALGGDEGSAYWLAWNLLKEYSRQADGRSPKTLVYDAVNRALDLHSDDEMVTRVVNEWHLDRTRIASLAPIVSQLYDDGDPFAKSLLSACAEELAALAITLYDKLGFQTELASGTVGGFVNPEEAADMTDLIPYARVSGTGGVFEIGPAVTEPFSRILREHNMWYVDPVTTPDRGALMLAIKHARNLWPPDNFLCHIGRSDV